MQDVDDEDFASVECEVKHMKLSVLSRHSTES